MANFARLSWEPPRTFAVVFDDGDSVIDGLRTFAGAEELRTASFTAIGAFRRATLAFFDVDANAYLDIPVDEQAEVVCMVGDIVRGEDGRWLVHAHAVLGLRDGSTRGGHLRGATVRPTLEVMLTESPAPLRRRYDKNTGLALIDLEDTSPIVEPDPLRHGLAPAH
jgi:predicted DNA-binding protein with PD1-like motif